MLFKNTILNILVFQFVFFVFIQEGFSQTAPVLTDIPDQTVEEGSSFATISLDDYVTDETADGDIIWTYSGNSELTVSISTDRIATIGIPDVDWNGSEAITFQAEDEGGLTSSDAATFTVTAVNDAPVLIDIPDQTVEEGSSFATISLDDYVTDETADGDIIWTYSGNSELTVSISTDRIATIGIPDVDWNGSEAITFQAEDEGGLTSSDAATFTVTAVNDAPVLIDIPDQTVEEGSSFATISLDDYVTDETADGDIIWTYSGNSELTVSISTDRIATIGIPDVDWNGSEAITFQAEDEGGLTSSDAATFTVTAVNDAPVLIDIPNQTVEEGSSFATISLDDYVTDETADGDIIWTYSGNSELTVSISTDRIATIGIPDVDWNGSEAITFQAEDEGGLTSSDAATFTVTAVNDAPVLIDIPDQTVEEGSSFATISLDDYVTDETADGDIIWTYSGNSELTVSISTDRIATIGIPDVDWNGSEAITFQAEDEGGLTSSDAATFTVTAVNDAPVLIDIPDQTVEEGSSFATISLDDYVTDETADGDIIWTYSGNSELTVSISTDRIATIGIPDVDWNGSEAITFQAEDEGGLTSSDAATFTVTAVNDAPVLIDIPNQTVEEGSSFATISLDDYVTDETADGDIIWTYSGNSELTVSISTDRIATIGIPDVDWNGSEAITFQAEDEGGLTSSDATTFTVTAVNDAPVLIDIPDQTVEEGSSFATISLDDYVTDETADGDIIWTYSGNSELTVSISTDRIATIGIPDVDWNGSEAITFQAEDEGGLTSSDAATFTVTAVNDAPVLIDIPNQTVEEGSSFATISLDDYVTDETADGDIIWTYSGNSELTVSISTDRIATIGIPDVDWNGSEAITFQAEDEGGLTSSDAATFTVTAVNDAPVLIDIPDQTVEEGSSFATISLDDYVTDETADGDIIWTYSGNSELTVSISTDRIATIGIPDVDWNGSEAITFQAEDEGGLTSSDAATFTVTAVNDAPVLIDIPNQTVEEGSSFATISLDDYVTDETADGDIIWTYSGNSELTVSISTDRIATIGIPDVDWNGSEAITFQAEDEGGLTSSDAATFTVTAVNDAPVLIDIPDQTVEEGSSFATISLDDYVTDETADGDIIWTYSGNSELTVSISTDRIATIGIPDVDWNGSEAITFQAEDEGGLTSSDAATFTVTAVNDAPVLIDIPNQTVEEGSSFATISLDDYVTDETADGDIIWTYSGNSELTVSISTDRIATIGIPDVDWNGSEAITFQAEDEGGLTSSDAATFTVTAVNDVPVTVVDAITVSEGGTVTSLNGGGLSVLENDNDIDGNTLTAVLKNNVSNGILAFNSDGTFSYTHNDSETTSDSFSYAANDGTVDGNTVIVTISITAVNDNSPVLNVESTIVEENHTGTVLTATSTDVDVEDSKSFSLSGDDYSLFTIGETSGVLSFITSPDYENPTDNGSDNIYDLTIIVRDGAGHEASENITVTVTDVNDNSPILNVVSTSIEENHTGVVLTATSTDADAGDSETYSISGTDASLFVIDPGSGELIFKNSPDYENPSDNGGNNVYDLNIIVTDDADHTDSESVTITVSAVNDNLPVISVESTTIYENHTGVVLTATSTDTDAGDSETYSISGTDYAEFDINSTNGELTFRSAPDFENPTDANQDNIYELTVMVTDGADHTDSESITITVQNVEETANFSIDAISAANVNENESYTSITPHITGSPIGDIVYTLGGTDASAFSINPSTGVVSMEARDYENPEDSNGDNVYSISITATDEDNNFVSTSWSVTIVPVNEYTPAINVGNVSLSENHTGTVTVASSTDQDDNDTESYSITGTDSELFNMNSSNGILTFINTPDYENPLDGDENNIYELTVVVSDGAGHSDSELITITISNLNDNTPNSNPDAISVIEGGTSTSLSGGNTSVLDNDIDADGDELTAVLMSNVSYGSLTLYENGTFNYIHDGSENHSDSFTYAANDGSSNGNIVAVSITVTPVNDIPVISDIPDQTRAEDVHFSTITLDSYIDDIETSDENISWSISPVPSYFDIVIDNRVASITPKDVEWNGIEVITFVATDESGASVYDNVRLEITAVNDEPVIAGQNPISIAEETLTELRLSDLIVEDPDNNYPTNYSMTILSGTNYVVTGTAITPNENVTGTITVQVYVVDPEGAQSNTYNLQVNVINDNDPPVVIDIPNQTIAEGANFTDINLNLYVSDPDNTNDQISWSYSGNSDLAIAIDEITKIASVEIPNEDWYGQESISFTASDGTLSHSNDVVLTVTAVNDAPIINSQQTLTYSEDVSFTIPFSALNVTDVDNTYSSQHEMTLLEGSNYTFSGRQVTPAQDFNGTLTIPVYISDLGPENQVSNTFNLSVTVDPVNDAPVIESQIITISTNEDVPVEISLDNISIADVDNESTDFSLILHSGENYTFDGTTITPALNYYGTLSVGVSASDGESINSESDVFTIEVLVLAQNDTPIANSHSVTTPENQQITININNLISDVEDGIDLSTLKIISDVNYGTTSIDAENAIITYDPNNGYSGADSFTYEICDNEGACASGVISILVSNEAPTGVNDIVVVDEDNSISINVISNDTDPQDNIDTSTLTLLSLPTNGEATIQTGGIVAYSPNSNYYGEDTFEYQVCDEDGYCTSANVLITVNAINDQPVIVSQNSVEIQEEGTYTVTLNDFSVTDIDNNYPTDFALSVLSGNDYTVVGNTITPAVNFNGEMLVNVIVSDQEQNNNVSEIYPMVISVIGLNDRPDIIDQSTLTTNEDESLTVSLTDLIVEDPDNNYPSDFVLVVLAGLNYTVSNNVITPVSNYSGFLNVPVYVSDQSEENDRSRIFNLVVEVISQNDAPVTQNVNYSTSENVSVEIDFADLVTDVDGNIDYSTFENISSPSSGSIEIDMTNFIVTYTPEQGFSGDDEFNFRFYDSEGLVSNISTIYININNEAPNAINDDVEVNEDEIIVISVLENDTDPQDNIDINSLMIINNTVNGELSLNSTTAEITYTPNENYFGTDNFRYRVFDDLGYSDDATVSISILPVNDIPVAVADEVETNEDESIIINVLNNDYDIDSDAELFTVSINQQPENGTAIINSLNEIEYTPMGNFNGSDVFEYQVCDDENGCNNAQVIVDVLPQNDAPVAYEDEVITSQNTEVVINVISNDIDIDDNLDVTSLSLLTQPSNGVCTVESLTGEITYVPNADFSGSDTFTYQICDEEGLCASATVIVNVSLQNIAPVCEDDNILMVDGETVTFSVLDNDSDVNGDAITVLIGDIDQLGGFLRVQENGVFTYTSVYGEYCIEEYFTYQGCDGSGNCDEATVKFIIGVADSDEDGIADFIEEQYFNTDGDEFPDYRDTDSDNDGILDNIEGGVSEICLQDIKDTDEDGIPDYRDKDSDDDGILDMEEGAEDCDNDGIPNFQDLFDDCAERIDAPDTFSPNGDGVNDYFLIPGISDYEGNEIFIYNRWGGEVFHMKNYDNKWDGKSSSSAIGSAELPQGLYFYVVKLGGSNGVIKGSVYIKR